MIDKIHLSKTSWAIGLLSLSLLSYELTLIQLFSYLQWYHFAYVIITIALLGFGVAGTVLTLYKHWILRNYTDIFSLLLLLSGVSMPLAILLLDLPAIRFDTYLLFQNYAQISRFILTCLILMMPFFFGALAIGMSFEKNSDHIGKLYYANLLGSALGGLCFLILAWFMSPERMPALLGLIAIMACWPFIVKRSALPLNVAGIFSVLLVVFVFWWSPSMTLSQFKDISKSLLLPHAEVFLERNGPFGYVQAVRSPHLRYAPGLSLTYRGEVHVREALYVNGNWYGAIIPHRKDEPSLFDFSTSGLAFSIDSFGSVLLLEARTGERIGQSLHHEVKHITAVEANSLVVDLLYHELAETSDSLFFHPGIEVINQDSRAYLATESEGYDIIILPPVNVFGGTSGVNATAETYLLTKEAAHQMWDRLNSDGMITVTAWLDYPTRDPLKLLATFVEILEEQGIPNVQRHLMAIKSWGTITFIIAKSPFTEIHIDRAQSFCEEHQFDQVLLAGVPIEDRNRYDHSQDTSFYLYLDEIVAPARKDFYSQYDFNIQPATDDQPYFFQNLKWKSFSKLFQSFGWRGVGFFELGYLLVFFTLASVMFLALILILLPLLRRKVNRENISWIVFYFSGLGIGYLFVEIVLIQQCILYVGHAIYASAGVITCMLLASGFGSQYSSKFPLNVRNLKNVTAMIFLVLIIYTFGFAPLLQLTISFSLLSKALILLMLIGPLGFIMGMPFPIGLSYLSKVRKGSIPWAWGLNGYFSVISSSLATIVALRLGFTWLAIFAASAYLITLIANFLVTEK